MSGWERDPEAQRWIEHVEREVAPLIEGSAATCSLVPNGEPDAKFAVELGFSIMFDKPIILVVPTGAKLPDHLVRVADRIVEGNPGDPDVAQRISAALSEIDL